MFTMKEMGGVKKRKAAQVFENYSGNISFVRGKKAVIRCLDPNPEFRGVMVDGDNYEPFKEFAVLECLPGEIEYFFNAVQVFSEYKTFVN